MKIRVGFLDFDLIADQTPQILNSLDPILNPDLTDFEVLYFDTLADAESNTTAAIIANPYRVNTSEIQPSMLEFIMLTILRVIPLLNLNLK